MEVFNINQRKQDQQYLAARAGLPKIRFARFFSYDSAKAIKAGDYDYLNPINYMAPHKSGGVGDLCGNTSPVCIDLCLGKESGRAAMANSKGIYPVRESRKRKAQYFMRERQAYMQEMLLHIAKMIRLAKQKELELCVRPNGSTDIAYEGVRVIVSAELAQLLTSISGHAVTAGVHTIFSAFPRVQYIDYTKNPRRFDRQLPANYYLTFSRSETNEAQALELLARGHNVAVVFAGDKPATWHGYPVIDADKHDLRHLDPRGGYICGLSPKGHKAKRDTRGFVVRDYQQLAMAA